MVPISNRPSQGRDGLIKLWDIQSSQSIRSFEFSSIGFCKFSYLSKMQTKTVFLFFR